MLAHEQVTEHAIGVQSLDHETEHASLPVEGALPSWLTGTLVRTGPARFEVGERSLNHWFDGLAMLHRFAFSDGEVGYSNRFLHSKAFEHAADRGDRLLGVRQRSVPLDLRPRAVGLLAEAHRQRRGERRQARRRDAAR